MKVWVAHSALGEIFYKNFFKIRTGTVHRETRIRPTYQEHEGNTLESTLCTGFTSVIKEHY